MLPAPLKPRVVEETKSVHTSWIINRNRQQPL